MGVIYSQADFDLDDAYLALTQVEQSIVDVAQNRELSMTSLPESLRKLSNVCFKMKALKQH